MLFQMYKEILKRNYLKQVTIDYLYNIFSLMILNMFFYYLNFYHYSLFSLIYSTCINFVLIVSIYQYYFSFIELNNWIFLDKNNIEYKSLLKRILKN